MRISDSERARIAGNLRAYADEHYIEPEDLCEVIECDACRGDEATVWHRLADLIDPDNIPDNADENAHGLSGRCDRDALLALADDLDYAGAAVENVAYIDQTFHESARRIRKAVNACEARPDAPAAVDEVQTATDARMDDSEAADGARTPSIEVLRWVKDNGGIEAVKKRLMPDGMEWPKVDGKPVDFVTGYEPSLGVLEAVSIYSNGACEVMSHDGIIKGVSEIHIAKPKVLDADGVEIRVGEKLYDVETGCKRTVRAVNNNETIEFDGYANRGWFAKFFTHRAPVLAADGRPLEVGQTVWGVDTGHEYVVVEPSYGDTVVVRLAKYDDAEGEQYAPDQLTHERPETWERLEEDAGKNPFDYCKDVGHRLDTCENSEAYKARDLVRRAKALAERSER